MNRCHFVGFALISLFIWPIGAGCAKAPVGIKGAVTVDNEPVTNGLIDFAPADGKGTTFGGKIEEGRFHIMGTDGVQPGQMKVQIRAMKTTGRKVAPFAGVPKDKWVDEIVQIVPEKYNTKTELTVELRAGEIVEQDFHLKGK